MRSIAAVFSILLLSLGLALSSGCGESAIDGHTRPTILSINGGTPIVADVWVVDTTLVSGGGIPEELVPFVFTNPPSQKFLDLTPDDPYGIFILESYTVSYEVLHEFTGGGVFTPGTLPTISVPCHLALPVGAQVETEFVLSPASLKMEFPVASILPGGTAPAGELIVKAEITFTGHESGSDRSRTLSTAATILFADYADED